jgi:geranylgeranyl diphosphate synthase, type II
MKSIQELSELISDELGRIEYPKTPSLLYEPIDYILALGGKRMRPILVLMGHQLFDKNIEKAISPALAIEIFHNFTLLHDDIMDNAPLRRGQKTVHEKWNNNVAILSGDTMLVQAYQLMAEVDNTIVKQVLAVFSKAAIEVCEGQQWDMDFETQLDVSISDYLKMIEYKTAVLLGAALQIGGITAGASKEEQNYLYDFGRDLGIAFQLKDDLLDAFGDTEIFGKQLGGDIMANKKTYLYLKAFALADEIQSANLEQYFSTNDTSQLKVDSVKTIFSNLDIPKLTTNLIRKYHARAMRNLAAINSENKEPLLAFSALLMDRVS